MAHRKAMKVFVWIGLPVIFPPPALAQVDSLGVIIVENETAVDDNIPWRVDDPITQIGGTTVDPKWQLYDVRGAMRRSDGAVLIANAGENELRLVDPDGVLTMTIGRQGGGPGEFWRIAGLIRGADDTAYVFDSRQQRISAFTDFEELAWEETVKPLARTFASVGRFEDGRWYALEEGRLWGGRRGTLTQDSVRLVFFDEMLRNPRVGAIVPGLVTASFTGVRGEDGKMMAPFSPRPVVHEYGDCLFLSSGADFDISVHRSDGRLVGIVRNQWDMSAVDSDAVDSWIRARVDRVPEEARPIMERVLSRVPRPNHIPPFSDLVVDALGYIWLQQYAPPDGPSKKWVVFLPDGTPYGRMEMPELLQVYEVGRDYLVGKWTTPGGEEAIGVFPLHREETADPVRSICNEDQARAGAHASGS